MPIFFLSKNAHIDTRV